jgi:hypothetical protein
VRIAIHRHRIFILEKVIGKWPFNIKTGIDQDRPVPPS